MNDDTNALAIPTDAGRRREVYIIDDDGDLRRSLHFLLSSSAITAWPFGAANDFLEQLPGLRAGPILLDIRMPEIDGMQLLTILNERAVRWPVIAMTAHGEVSVAVRAMKLGAMEFLEKPFTPAALNQALDLAFGALDQAEGKLRARDEARRAMERLSAREREIVALLVEGISNKQAARQLDLSVRTVEMHRGNAQAKLGVKSIAEIVALIAAADEVPQIPLWSRDAG